MIRARIEARVLATESAERVRSAIANVFPDAAFETDTDRLVGVAGDLAPLAKTISRQRISDSARSVLWRGRSPDGRATRFEIAKQAAAAGRLSFASVAGPLGDIGVTIEADSEEELLAFLNEAAPDTRSAAYRRGLSERELRELLKSDEGAQDELES